jgi:hypothetical protein
MNRERQNFILAGTLLAILFFSREWMQAHMARHMLLQMPMLAWVGWLLHAGLKESDQHCLEPWNRHGLTGFILFQCLAAFWMVPLALDLALISPIMTVLKITGWITAGFLLRQSMRQSHAAVQFFMLGNFAMMTAVVSDIYEHAPNRLCNAYGQNDQVVAAQSLLWMLSAILIAWVIHTWRVWHHYVLNGDIQIKLSARVASDRNT